MRLYHTGYEEIREPDIHHGRKNADFGQGFYMTEDEEYASRWARERAGRKTIMNTYELELEGLKVHRFERDAEWFEYIYNNRAGHADYLSSREISGEEIARYRGIVEKEEKEYQELFAKVMEEM